MVGKYCWSWHKLVPKLYGTHSLYFLDIGLMLYTPLQHVHSLSNLYLYGQYGRVKGCIASVACIPKCKPLAPGSEIEGRQFTPCISTSKSVMCGCTSYRMCAPWRQTSSTWKLVMCGCTSICVHPEDKQAILMCSELLCTKRFRPTKNALHNATSPC